MKLSPLLQPLADLAPEWATHVVWTGDGTAHWQDRLGDGPHWLDWRGPGWERHELFPAAHDVTELVAIDLRTGDIHLQSADGSITEVTQAEWGAE